MSDKTHKFGLSLTKKNPKPNAVEYHFKTVGEIFAAMDAKKLPRFIKAFKNSLTVAIALREASGAVCVQNGFPAESGDIQLESFTWIDD